MARDSAQSRRESKQKPRDAWHPGLFSQSSHGRDDPIRGDYSAVVRRSDQPLVARACSRT
ncbi:hypothetical protein QF000_006561 [Paraburkholderia atlantica]|nr:hypothetical protein [Paraburkholderia atlantica]